MTCLVIRQETPRTPCFKTGNARQLFSRQASWNV